MQRDLFQEFDLVETPAMEKGQATVWQCHWCGTLVAHPKTTKPATCPSCEHPDRGWTHVERTGSRYAGPFRAKPKHGMQLSKCYGGCGGLVATNYDDIGTCSVCGDAVCPECFQARHQPCEEG